VGAGSGEGAGSLTDIHGYKGGLEDAPEGFDCRGELLGVREPVVATENEVGLPDGVSH